MRRGIRQNGVAVRIGPDYRADAKGSARAAAVFTENGFCVLRAQARRHRDVVTVVGHAAAVAAGEWITASGEWVNDRTHGQQFKARFLRTSPPTSADGIDAMLQRNLYTGVTAANGWLCFSARPCPSRKSYPHVAMMQYGPDRCGDDGPRSLDGASSRRVLAQPTIGAWISQGSRHTPSS